MFVLLLCPLLFHLGNFFLGKAKGHEHFAALLIRQRRGWLLGVTSSLLGNGLSGHGAHFDWFLVLFRRVAGILFGILATQFAKDLFDTGATSFSLFRTRDTNLLRRRKGRQRNGISIQRFPIQGQAVRNVPVVGKRPTVFSYLDGSKGNTTPGRGTTSRSGGRGAAVR